MESVTSLKNHLETLKHVRKFKLNNTRGRKSNVLKKKQNLGILKKNQRFIHKVEGFLP